MGSARALGHADVNSRFAEADLASILDHHARTHPGPRHQASETRSLTQGTSGWSALPASSAAAPANDNDNDNDGAAVAAALVAREVS